MNDSDKNFAEELILNKLNSQFAAASNRNTSLVNTSQLQANDPIDRFLSSCGMSPNTSSTTIHSIRQRSPKEEITFYRDRVRNCKQFQEFWNAHTDDLPLMAALVRSYNIRTVSSVPSEAMFSKAGYVQRKHRS